MSFRAVMDLYDLLDDIHVDGQQVVEYLKQQGAQTVAFERVEGEKGSADFMRIVIPGTHGKHCGGSAPTLGIIGRLGGLGARPQRLGFTSDGDGALAALAAAAKLARMQHRGDQLYGDVIITTQICPTAPTRAHEPVPFMDSPVSSEISNRYEVDGAMDAILCIDTTKGNRIVNRRGFAITPTVCNGWILKTSEDLLSIMSSSTGDLPSVLPITMQDITPYGNGVYHLNSILQPSVATDKPCVGVAITTVTGVAGCATGASHLPDIDEAVRFVIEVAKEFTQGHCDFLDAEEFERIQSLYGSMAHLRTQGLVY